MVILMDDRWFDKINEIKNRLLIWESCAPEIAKPLVKDIAFLLEVVSMQEAELDSLYRHNAYDI